MLFLRRFLFLSAAPLIAACNSTTTETFVPPEGFATASTQVGDGSEFSERRVPRITLVNGERSIKQQRARIDINDDGSEISIVVNDQAYALSFAQIDGFGFSEFSNNKSFLESFYSNNSDVQIVLFEHDTDTSSSSAGYENLGHFAIGFLTDPNEIAALSGTASYSGRAQATVYSGNIWDYAVGNFAFTADFSTSSIGGDILMSDGNPNQFLDFQDLHIAISADNANIVGNTFVHDLVRNKNAPSTAVVGGFSGAFYGMDAASVGGTFWVDDVQNGVPLLYQGAFASD